MRVLISDVVAVIRHLGHRKAIVVGHDWGAAIAWQVALWRPDVVEKLVILNMPHPNGFGRELSSKDSKQHGNSRYARDFQKPGAAGALTAAKLAGWVKDAAARKLYVEAFERSDFDKMLAYYSRNFPSGGTSTAPPRSTRRVKAPVMMIHGLDDEYLLADGLNDTWKWLDADLTLVTVPGAGHFVQQDRPGLVTRSIASWLRRDGAPAATSAAMRALANPKCPFSGRAVRPDSITLHEGRVIGFCNTGCRDKFAHDPTRFEAQVTRALKQR